jgi:hypothetical protein
MELDDFENHGADVPRSEGSAYEGPNRVNLGHRPRAFGSNGLGKRVH